MMKTEIGAEINNEVINMIEKNWHEVFKEFLASLTTITNGKQQYFEQ